MTLNYDNQSFKTLRSVYSYIARTYPDEIETKALDFMNVNYEGVRPAVYNQRLAQLFTDQPELIEKNRKRSMKKVRKSLGGKVLNNITEVCAALIKEGKDSNDYGRIPTLVANIFDDEPDQFANKFAHIRYKKKLMELLRKSDEIPEEVKERLKLKPQDSKEYGKYQNDRQREYHAKKKLEKEKQQETGQEAPQEPKDII